MWIIGDLGQTDAGNDLAPKVGLLTLRAQSIGRFGLVSQLPGGSRQSDIIGAMRSPKLAEGIRDAVLLLSGESAR